MKQPSRTPAMMTVAVPGRELSPEESASREQQLVEALAALLVAEYRRRDARTERAAVNRPTDDDPS